ncbi:MAG: AAA family ATPase [Treponema sp.]
MSRPRRFGKSLLISTLEYYFFKIQSVFFYFTNSHNSAIIRTMTDELFSTIKNELAKKNSLEKIPSCLVL